jgi:hypothetical protein
MMIPEFLKIENYNRWQFPVSDTRGFSIPPDYLTGKIIFRYTPEIGNLSDSGTLIYSIKIPGFGTYSQESYLVPVSLPNDRKFIEVDLDLSLPIELKFICPLGVKKGCIELFAYKQSLAEDFDSTPMGTNNPFIPQITPEDITAGMVAAAPQLATAIASEQSTVLSNQAAKSTAKSTKDHIFTIKGWSGDPANHLILEANPGRLGIKALNMGNNRVYIDMGSPDDKSFNTRDEFIDKYGTFKAEPEERTLPMIMYLDANKPSQEVSITELFP